MIRSFTDKATERLFRDGACPARWRTIETVALRKLDMVDAATRLDDLLSPPGNRLEALKGHRRGQHSIRINRQWRVCFPLDARRSGSNRDSGLSLRRQLWHGCELIRERCCARNIWCRLDCRGAPWPRRWGFRRAA